jgi:hypothetical protein
MPSKIVGREWLKTFALRLEGRCPFQPCKRNATSQPFAISASARLRGHPLFRGLSVMLFVAVACFPMVGTFADDFSNVWKKTASPDAVSSNVRKKESLPDHPASKGRKNQGSKEVPLIMEAGPASEHFQCLELLGFPTDTSIQIHLIPRQDMKLSVEYGAGKLDERTPPVKVRAGEAHIFQLEHLKPDTEYICRIDGGTHCFHTARPPGAAFSFAVQADPHLDENSSLMVYSNTQNNILLAKPDFLIDLGDSSMVDKLREKNNESITTRHLLMRNWYGHIAHSVPLLMVPGNHDGELGWLFDGTDKNSAVRATNIRKLFYPIAPDMFYSSAAPDEPFCGTVRSYYAWTWGDALFVTIDPYRYTLHKPGKNTDGWGFTLGETQYRWLRATLENSNAKFKFVFGHQLVGGDEQGRGGVERADWYEWGGQDPDGTFCFDEKRPGWGKPIHQLLVDNGVNVYFHGHDHFYARQEKDGVIYQLVPQPAHENNKVPGYAADYGYTTGDLRGGSGFINVSVSSDGFDMTFVQSESPRKEKKQGRSPGG